MLDMPPPFRVIRPAGPGVPVVAHVPHASTVIPDPDRTAILLDDAGLQRELVRMTDWHTDRLFDFAVHRGATALLNGRSRLVMDPERFADEAQEPMGSRGQGVVYTRTSDGTLLRDPDARARQRTITSLFEPYHAALSGLVGQQLDTWGRCTILDCHSFGSVPLPSELDQALDRPDICIGTDRYHTPPSLAEALEAGFSAQGFRVRRDSPFDGALVPLDRYRTDLRVRAVMVEVRRGLYCDESTGALTADFPSIAAAIEQVITEAQLFT